MLLSEGAEEEDRTGRKGNRAGSTDGRPTQKGWFKRGKIDSLSTLHHGTRRLGTGVLLPCVESVVSVEQHQKAKPAQSERRSFKNISPGEKSKKE